MVTLTTQEPIVRRLVWSHVVLAFFAAGVPVLCLYISGVKPRDRPFYIFDARISYPKKASTLPAAVCVTVSAAITIVQILVSEFYLLSAPGKWLRSIQAILNLFAAFAYQIFVQQLSAFVAGKHRPDFIVSCKPDASAYTVGLLRDAPVTDFALDTSVCTTDSDIKDHLKSFPSGHASSTACLTFFGMTYFAYTYYIRRDLGKREMRHVTFWGRFWGDLQLGLIGVGMFAEFVWIWMVGVSRWIDNKHGVDDVNSGWYLGTVFAVWGVWETFAHEHRVFLLRESEAAELALAKAREHDNGLDAQMAATFAQDANALDNFDRNKPSGGSANAVELGEVKSSHA